MDTTLTATSRANARGKSDARKVRMAGMLPAVVYGGSLPSATIQVDPNALVEMFRKTGDRNTIVSLEHEGTTSPCIVREVQRHPLSREILHVDFYRLADGQPVTVEVPLVMVGKAKGLAMGGRVQLIRRALNVRAAYTNIPRQIEVDVTELDVGETMRISKVKMPEGVVAVFDQDYPVATVTGKIKDRAEEGATAAAAPAAGKGAAGKAAPAGKAAAGKAAAPAKK